MMTDDEFLKFRRRYERKQRKQERDNNYRGVFPPGYVSFLTNASDRTNMTTFELIRRNRSGKAVNGQIRLSRWVGDKLQFDSLENADYLITAGTYEVKLTHSPRFGKKLPLLMNVPGRTGIRIHTGSKPEHSKGCILVGAIGKRLIEQHIERNTKNNVKSFITIKDVIGDKNDLPWQHEALPPAPQMPQLALPAHAPGSLPHRCGRADRL